jgi:hypothetical protein
MTFADYLALPAVNWSSLKAGRDSALHYKWRSEHPMEDSARLALGRAAHTAVFEPDRFMLDYALFTGPRRAGKEWDACCAANKGRTILKADEYRDALAMRDAVRSHPVAGVLLTPPGEAEKVLTWTDEATGIECKARLDWYRPGLLCDLKTTTSIDDRLFGALAHRMGYVGQMAFYHSGLVANGLDAPMPKIIAVEALAPHDVAVFTLTDDVLYQGEQEAAELLRMVSAGRFSKLWPGRYPEERPLQLPSWAFPSDDGGISGLDLLVNGQGAIP